MANRTTVKRGGGIAAYINSNINYSTNELAEFNVSSEFAELLWLSIKNPKHRDYTIGIVYRPPQGNIKKFTDLITETVNKIPNLNKQDIFMLGDFNINNYADSKNKGRKHLKDFESLTGLKQLITQTTRYSSINSTIDLIFIYSDYINNHGTLHIDLSDHEAIFGSRKTPKESFNVIHTVGRSYVNYNKECFQQMVINCNWEELTGIQDVDKYWDIVESNITFVLDALCPVKKIKIKDKGEPWKTRELIELIHDKERLRKKAKRTNNVEDWRQAKIARNLTKNALKKVKADFIKENLERYKGDTKRGWDQINTLLPRNGSRGIINLIDNGRNIENDEVAQHINTYFTNVGPSLAEKFTVPVKRKAGCF